MWFGRVKPKKGLYCTQWELAGFYKFKVTFMKIEYSAYYLTIKILSQVMVLAIVIFAIVKSMKRLKENNQTTWV